MNRSLLRITAYLQLGIMILMSTGCAPTQPFFLNESPDLQYYLNTATSVEYPDVCVESLPETTEALPPLTIGNHDYKFWDLTLEECVSIAVQNARFFLQGGGGTGQGQQRAVGQFIGARVEQVRSIYDVAVTQATTQTVPLTIDSNGNRVLPRGVVRANQIGGVEDALAEFDAQASGFYSVSTTDRPQNTRVDVATDTISATQQSAISKRFATGGIATLRQQTLYNRTKTPIASTLREIPSDWTAVLEAEVQHPLMRNRGTMVNRIPVVLASLNEDIEITEFELQVRNLVRDVETAYWDLYVAYRNVSTAIIGRNSAIATAQFARLNLENGTGTRQEVAQAVEQYYQFRARMEAALAGGSDEPSLGVYGQERQLRALMGLSPTDGRLIRPVDEPTLAPMVYDWDESVAEMLYLRPEIRRHKFDLKQTELELVSAKNQILPDVSLSLLYRWVGVGDSLGPPNGRAGTQGALAGTSALAGLTGGNFQEGVARLEITPPAFGARRELTRIRGAQLRLARNKAFLQELERLSVSELSDAVSTVATDFRLVQTQAQRWQAAEQEVAARLAEYKGGRSPVNVVLQSQLRRAEAQIAYYRALGNYNKSVNLVEFVKGTSLINNNITLAEGPWNKKAYWDALERARERSAGRKYKWGVTRPGVVRQGPVGDAEHAHHAIGSGVTDGSLPPRDIAGELGIELDPGRQPVDVDDVPLSEMGSPTEMFSPDPNVREIESIVPEVVPSDSQPSQPMGPIKINGPSVLVPSEESLPTPSNPELTQAGYQDEAIQVSLGPEPVRRKPLPTGR